MLCGRIRAFPSASEVGSTGCRSTISWAAETTASGSRVMSSSSTRGGRYAGARSVHAERTRQSARQPPTQHARVARRQAGRWRGFREGADLPGVFAPLLMEPLRLLTFGGLNLLVGGYATTGSATRRRRLALLALLAVPRDRGLNRDKVQAYLWPESDTERARHGLNQLVYFQRRHLGSGDLFLGKKTLRLNRAMITTDVWDFEDALDAGAHEVAVRLYAGPFLDGFFVREAPGFERGVDEQRRRLA